jgi:hypothetical protein
LSSCTTSDFSRRAQLHEVSCLSVVPPKANSEPVQVPPTVIINPHLSSSAYSISECMRNSCSRVSRSVNTILGETSLPGLSQRKPRLFSRTNTSHFAVYFHPGITAGSRHAHFFNFRYYLGTNNRITSESNPICKHSPSSNPSQTTTTTGYHLPCLHTYIRPCLSFR